MTRRLLAIAALIMCALPISFARQDKSQVLIRPKGEEMIVAVADVQPQSADKAGELSEALKTFNQVVWDDLKFSGFFTLAGKSFYPPQPIVRPEDVNYDAWNAIPFKVSALLTGNLDVVGGVLRAEMRVYDMKQRGLAFGQRMSADTDQIRGMAHRWADEVVYRLTAGQSRGIASTKIAYVSRRGNAKEIFVMDYDGYNQRQFTHNNSLNLFPNWAPDNSKLVFVSYRTGKPEVNIHSYLDGSRLPFPMFNTLAYAAAIAPDGNQIVFSLRSTRSGGDSDLYVSKVDGTDRRDITNNPFIDTSPTWAPSGKQIAFVSDREGGVNQIYICDSDGANVRRIVKEGGDADSPAWSPDGRFIAFHWKPHLGTAYDIFLAEVSSGKIFQVTSNAGSNESPSWAPDGRHLAFQTNRTGTNQIAIMELGESQDIRLITTQGTNSSPAWSGYMRQ
jgi:TolB protein